MGWVVGLVRFSGRHGIAVIKGEPGGSDAPRVLERRSYSPPQSLGSHGAHRGLGNTWSLCSWRPWARRRLGQLWVRGSPRRVGASPELGIAAPAHRDPRPGGWGGPRRGTPHGPWALAGSGSVFSEYD